MKKLIVLVILFLLLPTTNYQLLTIKADSVTENALNFLKSKQDANGKITTGFSAPSQWSAIAFATVGIDIATVKNSDKSLKDFLLTDIPSEPSSATDWENRILAIVAQGYDPANFGGVNYIQKLESFYNTGQIGDTCSLNDDVFGLLALVASGTISSNQIKQDTLNFLIQKQDPQDGGFGFSAPGCDWYSTASDMTSAALQALQAAKENGLSNPSLDDAIEKSKKYLFKNQNPDGGFGYFGASDSDTTGWVLMALNVLGLIESEETKKAKNWLLTMQSKENGGFQSFDYGANALVSNATTTAQALIALSGKGWIIRIYNPQNVLPSDTSTATPSSSLNPTPKASPSNTPAATSIPTPSPTPTPTLIPTPSPSPSPAGEPSPTTQLSFPRSVRSTPPSPPTIIPTPSPSSKTQSVLGATNTKSEQKSLVDGMKENALPMLGVFGLFATFKFLEGRRWRE